MLNTNSFKHYFFGQIRLMRRRGGGGEGSKVGDIWEAEWRRKGKGIRGRFTKGEGKELEGFGAFVVLIQQAVPFVAKRFKNVVFFN